MLQVSTSFPPSLSPYNGLDLCALWCSDRILQRPALDARISCWQVTLLVGTSTRPFTSKLTCILLVYVEDNQWDTVKISGVGLAEEDESDPVCPEHQHQRYDDEGLDPDSTIYIHLGRETLDPKPAHGLPPLSFAGFGFHAECWDVLTMVFRPDPKHLFQLCLSMPVGSDGILDWGHDYGGAAAYSTIDLVPEITRRSLDTAPEGAVYQANPLESTVLRNATGRVPRLEASYTVLSPTPTTDSLSRLPPEILERVFNHLPSRDVAHARLASRTFASVILSEGFWASRFQRGFEFHHISEVSSSPPQSWRTLYAILRNGAQSAPGLENRRRIWGLGLKIQSLYSQMLESSCHGSPVSTLLEPSAPQDTGDWHLAKASLEPPASTTFSYGCRPLRSRLLELSAPLKTAQIFVSFVLINDSRFVSGIRFVAEDGSSHRLGYIHPAVEESISLPAQSSIQEWYFAVNTSGIKAIAIRPTDGTLSPWVGERGNLPLWHLSTSSDIHRIKAEFDVSCLQLPRSMVLLLALYLNCAY